MDTIAMTHALPQLDPREQHFRIPSPRGQNLRLFLRYLPAHGTARRTVLYVHGGTFPSALSIAHRFDGRSWRDALGAAGCDVWGLDFHGFGAADPYPEMAEPAADRPPLGKAETAAAQLDSAMRFIVGRSGVPRLSIIAHSWGTIAVGLVAER